MPSKLAFYKYGPSKSVPQRPGPIQCVRRCSACFPEIARTDDPSIEDITAVMSYDNLLCRQWSWIGNYQSIQYHVGQINLMKRSFTDLRPSRIIYVVAATEKSDIDYLRRVLTREGIRLGTIVRESMNPSQIKDNHIVLPMELMSCPITNDKKLSGMLDLRHMRDILEHFVQLSEQDLNPNEDQIVIVPVAITKDHEKSPNLGIGSLCIQILEPYLLNSYVHRLKTQFKTGHLVQHLYHDLSVNAACLPSHVVAFLLLYLDRPQGVTRQDLTEQMDWLRKSAMDLNLHMAFTGSSEKVVEFALLLLNKYILFDQLNQTIIPTNVEALTIYASLLVPNVAYIGVISRAILMLHNLDEKNPIRMNLSPGETIKVMKDDLLELSENLAEALDTKLASRAPCMQIQDLIVNVFTNMLSCGHYFRISEPRIRQNAGRRWAGDYDSDEEYYMSRRDDPAFKPWVVMTQRPYRLDRLNLFMNAIEPFISCEGERESNLESSSTCLEL